MSTGLPLSQFATAFVSIRGHASALLVNRRNEGDHRSIHLSLRLTPNISPALVMARLRWQQTEQLLTSSSFVTFAAKLWSRRGKHSITHQLLDHKHPHFQIDEMSWLEKVSSVYGTSLSDTFADTSTTSEAIVAFNAQVLRATPPVHTPLESDMIAMYRNIFEVGAVFSFPSAVLSGGDVAAQAITLSAIVAAFSDTTPPTSGELESHVFVEVAKSHKNVVVSDTPHLAPTKTVRFMRLDVLSIDAAEVKAERTGAFINADLSDLVRSSHLSLLLRGLTKWILAYADTRVAPKRLRLMDAVASNESRMSNRPLNTDDVGVLALLPGGAGDFGYVARHDDAAAQDEVISDLWARGAMTSVSDVGALSSVSVLDIDSFDVVQQLVDRGVAALSEDAFGDTRVALVSSASDVKATLALECEGLAPIRDATARVHPAMSKVELLALCVSLGWQLDESTTSWTAAGPKCFKHTAYGSTKWLWLVLATSSRIWGLGISEIWDGMPAKYYELLYHCRDASLLISFGLQVRRWKHGQFLALLEGKDPLVLPALQDAPVELDPDPDEASDMEELPAPSDHPATRHVPVADRSQARAPVSLSGLEGGQNATVMFDGGSHQSGKERAYIKCQCHSGEGCVQYRFLHHFDSDRECVS